MEMPVRLLNEAEEASPSAYAFEPEPAKVVTATVSEEFEEEENASMGWQTYR